MTQLFVHIYTSTWAVYNVMRAQIFTVDRLQMKLMINERHRWCAYSKTV